MIVIIFNNKSISSMRVTKEKFAENRASVLEAAAVSFRARGVDGVGIADIMGQAGLTHGGFYRHFASKEDLLAQASAAAFDQTVVGLQQVADAHPDAPLEAMIQRYLSDVHRTHAQYGCPAAALGGEAPRQASGVRRAFSSGVQSMFKMFERLSPGGSRTAARRRAVAGISGMVGAMVLARAVDDPALAEEILSTMRDELIGRRG